MMIVDSATKPAIVRLVNSNPAFSWGHVTSGGIAAGSSCPGGAGSGAGERSTGGTRSRACTAERGVIVFGTGSAVVS